MYIYLHLQYEHPTVSRYGNKYYFKMYSLFCYNEFILIITIIIQSQFVIALSSVLTMQYRIFITNNKFRHIQPHFRTHDLLLHQLQNNKKRKYTTNIPEHFPNPVYIFKTLHVKKERNILYIFIYNRSYLN